MLWHRRRRPADNNIAIRNIALLKIDIEGADVGDSLYDHAHNDYLKFLTEYGLVGILLLGGVIVISLRKTTLAPPRRHSTFMRGIAFTAVMAVTAWSFTPPLTSISRSRPMR